MKKTKSYNKDEILAMENLFLLVDLPEENRTRVIKVVNPFDWHVVRFTLDGFAKQRVTVRFSADVKRVGVAGSLTWQINNKNYPSVGMTVYGAKTDVWHKCVGEWTGFLEDGNPMVYLNTWKNNSEKTTYYIDNVKLEVTQKETK